MGYLEEGCPFCHKAFNDYIQEIPEDKWISIDIPLDAIEYEWQYKYQRLLVICRYINEEYGPYGKLRLRPAPTKGPAK